MKYLAVTCAVLFAFTGSGCSLILTGRTDRVMVEVSPPGSTVFANRQLIAGRGEILVMRNSVIKITTEDGVLIEEIRPHFNRVSCANILVGVIPGMIVDLFSGAYLNFPETVCVTLPEEAVPGKPGETEEPGESEAEPPPEKTAEPEEAGETEEKEEPDKSEKEPPPK
ncbi:MAG: hypothetical protein ACYS8W_03065 [Planctomycetota bacterium]|jgi:hypothetical protein